MDESTEDSADRERVQEINGSGKEVALPTQRLTDGVCERCFRMWDRLPWKDIPKMEFGEIPEFKKVLKTPACRICRFLASTVSSRYGIDKPIRLRYQNYTYTELNSDPLRNLAKTSPTDPFQRLPATILDIFERGWWFQHDGYPIFFATPYTPSNINILEDSIEIGSFKTHLLRCMRDCELFHGHSCMTIPVGRLNAVRVIDCTKREVVQMPTECKYVALSYVWGSLKTSPQLKDAPATIRDSITVTLLLGYQYLWIDRYCIDQENARDKHVQILQMSDIYGAAQLTIIAAAGGDPSYGLPGLNTLLLRRECRTEKLGHFLLIDTPKFEFQENIVDRSCKEYDEVEKSCWFSRAWTFQECFSTRRRLFFTDTTVFYACNSRNRSEPMSGTSRTHSFASCLPPLHNTRLVIGGDPSAMFSRLELYTSRQLSYDSDALAAILSTLESFANDKYPIHHIWAVPVYKEYRESQLVIALCFHHLQPCRRRHEFPSWSILGWDGPVRRFNAGPMEAGPGWVQTSLSLSRSPESSDAISLESWLMDKSSINIVEQPRYLKLRTWGQRASVVVFETQGQLITEGYYAALFFNARFEILLRVDWDILPSEGSSLLCASIDNQETSILILQKGDSYYERVGIHIDLKVSNVLIRDRETGHVVDETDLPNVTEQCDRFKRIPTVRSLLTEMTIVIG